MTKPTYRYPSFSDPRVGDIITSNGEQEIIVKLDQDANGSLIYLALSDAALDALVPPPVSPRSKRTIQCDACKDQHRIGELDAIATYFYVRPSGCTDGDYWLEGEWHFVCPATAVRNRLLFHQSWEERENGVDAEDTFKRMFRSAFKSMAKEYEHGSERTYLRVNNRHIDENRLAWGLPEWVPAVPGRVR